MSDPPEASRTRPILFVATVIVALLVVGLAAAATPAAAADAGDEEITAEVTGETYFGSQANEVTVTHTYSEDTDLDVSVPGKASAEDVAGEDEIVLDLGGMFYGAKYPVTVVAEVDGQTYRATLEEKGQSVTLEPVEAGEFDSASAEVTRVNYFGEAKKVAFTYQAPEGSTVQFQAGSRTVTETADGTETTKKVRVGSFFYGPDFPVEVTASIVGGESVSGEIPDRNTEVVLVEEDDRSLESIELELDQTELEVGDTTGSTVTAHYDDGSSETVTADSYGSSDESVATVDDGVVTAEGEGDAAITAEYQGESADASVSVDDPLRSLDLDLAETELEVGDTTGSTVTATYASGDQEVTADAYTSSDESVATVDESGVVTAEGEGEATITAEFDGETADASVNVSEPVVLESIELSLAETELVVGDTTGSTVTAHYTDGSTETVTADAYGTSDESVATVDADGVVTAEGEGSATIAANYQGESAEAPVSVEDPLESITLELDQTELGIDDTTGSTVTAEYASGATEDVTADAAFSSSDENVATVDADGQVTAVGSGSAEITAEYEGLSDTASVSVEVELESIDLSLAETELVVDDTTGSTVTATYTDGSTETVTADSYASSDESVATVDDDGVVTAEGEGSATITAEYQGESDSADVSVDDPLESITLELGDSELGIDDTTGSTVTAEYASGATADVTADATYSSSDDSVATVDADGTVTAVGSGSAEITAEYQGESDTASVSVEVELESIDLALDENELVVDDTTGSTVTATFTDDSTADVTDDATYSSSDESVATVDADGVVTAEGEGSATITAEYQGESASADVSVTDPIQSITLELGDTELDVNDETDATVTAERASGATEDVTSAADITSTDTDVATVADATVSAVGAGDADIDAAYDGLTDSVSITVADPVVNVDLALDATELEVDDDTSSTVTAEYASGATEDVTADATYSSSDESVATVDADGAVTAVGSGSAEITAEYEGQSDTATVTVTDPVDYQSFTAYVDGEYMQIGQGEDADNFALDQCPEGQAEGNECTWFMGEANEDGSFTIGPDALSFAETETYSDALGDNISVVITAPDGIEVQPDFETGEMTFTGTLDIEIPEFTELLPTDSCGFTVDVDGTTGQSGDINGEPLDLDEDTGVATATIVDGTFEVGSVSEERCPQLHSAIEDQLSLPSPSGENEAELGMYFEFSETELPEYDVEITDTNAPVNEGETLTVDADVTNVGGAGSQQVALDVDQAMAADQTRDSEYVALDAGESTSVTLEWDSSESITGFDGEFYPINNGTFDVTVTSNDDSATQSVEIQPQAQPANFDVTIDDYAESVAAGEALDVTATVENTGDETDTQDVTLTADGTEVDSASVQLDGGQSSQETLTWQTSEGDAAEGVTLEVTSDDASDSVTVDVTESGPATPDSFTAVGQQGQLKLGTSHADYTEPEDIITMPECTQYTPGDSPDEETTWEDTCFAINVSEENLNYVDETFAEWEASAEDITFPYIETTVQDAVEADVFVQMGAPSGMSGTVDFETGELTADAEFEIYVEIDAGIGSATCEVQTDIAATSGTSGEDTSVDNGLPDQMTGEHLTIDEDAGTATATLVENELTVPTMTEIDTGGIGVDCTNADESYYLPADQPGENYFQYDFWIDMEGLN